MRMKCSNVHRKVFVIVKMAQKYKAGRWFIKSQQQWQENSLIGGSSAF